MAKVLDFNKKSHFKAVIDEMIEYEREGLITDLVLTYRRGYTDTEKAEEKDTDAGMMCRYWFGESSSTFCLGLNHNMSFIIGAYMNNMDLLDGD